MSKTPRSKTSAPSASAGAAPTRRSAWRTSLLLAALLPTAGLLGCDGDAGAAQAGDSKNVAVVGSDSVSRADLLSRSAGQLENVELERVQCVANSEKKRYDVLEANLEGLVRERLRDLAAAEAGVSGEAWLDQERAKRLAEVPDEQVDQIISNNPRLARANRAQIEPQVRSYLADEALYEELKTKYPVDYQLEPYRVQVAADGPGKGPATAPVTIVEFSDFQCPYCKRVVPALDQAVEEYGDKVRLVFRQFPLNSIHPEAQKAAEASLCADDQGKFWPMHDAMFTDQKKLSVADLEAAAAELELDVEKFSQCLESNKYAERVSADIKAGALIGVSGTPALFINGRPMSGAVSFEALSEVIDEELERQGAD